MNNHTFNKMESTEPFTIYLKRAEGSISDLCFFLFIICALIVASFMLIFDRSLWKDASINWRYILFLCWFVALSFFFLYLILKSCFVEVMMTEKYLINCNRLTKQTKKIRLDHISSYQVLKYYRRSIHFIKLKDINSQSHHFVYSPEALDPYFLSKMKRQGAKDMNEGKMFGDKLKCVLLLNKKPLKREDVTVCRS